MSNESHGLLQVCIATKTVTIVKTYQVPGIYDAMVDVGKLVPLLRTSLLTNI